MKPKQQRIQPQSIAKKERKKNINRYTLTTGRMTKEQEDK